LELLLTCSSGRANGTIPTIEEILIGRRDVCVTRKVYRSKKRIIGQGKSSISSSVYAFTIASSIVIYKISVTGKAYTRICTIITILRAWKTLPIENVESKHTLSTSSRITSLAARNGTAIFHT